MPVITDLRPQKYPRKRINLYLDHQFAFALSADLVEKEALRVGQQLSEEEVAVLPEADLLYQGRNAALSYLSYRPRSEQEIRLRLRRQGLAAEAIDQIMIWLRERKLVDDTAFAQFWLENRDTFRPRSRRMLETEFRQKGIVSHIVKDVLAGVNEEEAAYRVAHKKAAALGAMDYTDFRNKMGPFLQRRGFGYDTVSSVVARLWKERQEG